MQTLLVLHCSRQAKRANSTSSKDKGSRPGKNGDMRPCVYVRLQRATNPTKGEAKRWFLVDTGATRTSITQADAKCLNLFAKSQETGSMTAKNAAGSAARPTVRISITALEGSKQICAKWYERG